MKNTGKPVFFISYVKLISLLYNEGVAMSEKKSFITESDKSLNKFLIKYFFKSKVGPIIALIFPILFMAMYAVISTHKEIPGGK